MRVLNIDEQQNCSGGLAPLLVWCGRGAVTGASNFIANFLATQDTNFSTRNFALATSAGCLSGGFGYTATTVTGVGRALFGIYGATFGVFSSAAASFPNPAQTGTVTVSQPVEVPAVTFSQGFLDSLTSSGSGSGGGFSFWATDGSLR